MTRTWAWTSWPGLACIGLLSFFSAGCGGDGLYSVRGKAMYKGQPMAGGTVMFHRKGETDLKAPKPGGQIADDGTFELSTEGEPGAPPGEYLVTFYWEGPKGTQKPKGMAFGGASEGGKTVLPPEYTYPDKTKIEVTVKAESNDLPTFELK